MINILIKLLYSTDQDAAIGTFKIGSSNAIFILLQRSKLWMKISVIKILREVKVAILGLSAELYWRYLYTYAYLFIYS